MNADALRASGARMRSSSPGCASKFTTTEAKCNSIYVLTSTGEPRPCGWRPIGSDGEYLPPTEQVDPTAKYGCVKLHSCRSYTDHLAFLAGSVGGGGTRAEADDVADDVADGVVAAAAPADNEAAAEEAGRSYVYGSVTSDYASLYGTEVAGAGVILEAASTADASALQAGLGGGGERVVGATAAAAAAASPPPKNAILARMAASRAYALLALAALAALVAMLAAGYELLVTRTRLGGGRPKHQALATSDEAHEDEEA